MCLHNELYEQPAERVGEDTATKEQELRTWEDLKKEMLPGFDPAPAQEPAEPAAAAP